MKKYDSIVIGGGHAGVEASLSLARTGNKTLLITLTKESLSFMPCNPSIGGTAKGELPRGIWFVKLMRLVGKWALAQMPTAFKLEC